jgi:hypothetical protein
MDIFGPHRQVTNILSPTAGLKNYYCSTYTQSRVKTKC